MIDIRKLMITLFVLVLTSANAYSSDSLTLYVFKSPNGIVWETPKKLIHSVLSNAFSFKDRMIGHVAVELSCDSGLEGKASKVLTGMNYVDKHIYKKQLLLEGMGFSVIFQSVLGKLEKEEDLSREIDLKSKVVDSPRLTFMKYLISPQTCLRLLEYHQGYVENKYYKNYGLPNNPRKGEGAGCSAFGISFLEVAGILTDSNKKSWSFSKRLSNDLLGGAANLSDPDRSVSFFDVFFMDENHNRWLAESEAGRSVFFYDPDKIFEWIQTKIRKQDLSTKTIKINNMQGLLIDSRSEKTPTESIWTLK